MKQLYNCSLKVLYASTIFVVLVIVGAWWYFIYDTLEAQIKFYKSYISRINHKKDILLKSQEEIAQLKKSIIDLESRYSALHNSCSLSHGITYCKPLLFILASLADNNITLYSYKPLEEIEKTDSVNLMLEFTLDGSFFDYLNFFKSIYQSNYLIKFKKCSLDQKNNKILCSCILAIKSIKDYEKKNFD